MAFESLRSMICESLRGTVPGESLRRNEPGESPPQTVPGAILRRNEAGESLQPQLEIATVELPDYDVRRLVRARDPLASVDAFTAYVRLVLARLMGIRMCPLCPHCNAKDSQRPCQNKFGSNMEAMGGIRYQPLPMLAITAGAGSMGTMPKSFNAWWKRA